MTDAKAEQNPPEFQRLAGLNFTDQVLCRLPAHSVEFFDLLDSQLIKIGNIANQLRLNELIDDLVTQTIDLHRSSTGPMQKRFFDFCWTGLGNASADGLP